MTAKPKSRPGAREKIVYVPYSDAVAQAICDRIADGESLRSICKSAGMPSKAAVMLWLRDPAREDFRRWMEEARETQADDFVDEQNQLSAQLPERHPEHGGYDSAHVAHIRNRISTLQWMAEKLKPKKYGAKAQVEHSGGVQIQVVTGVPEDGKDDE